VIHDDYYCTPIVGYVDRSAPELLNLPQPSDGILRFGETISASFTEFINPDNILAPDDITLEIVRTATEVDINITRFENSIYILPNIANYWIENETMRAKVSGISDLYGNPLEDEVTWEFFVNANPVSWEQPKIEIIKALGETMTVTARLQNSGGQYSSFSITGLPDWLTVNLNSGSLLPLETQTLVFSISNQLGYGTHRDTVYADVNSLGMEPLIFEISVLANPPSWASTQLNTYDYSMTITGELEMEGEISDDTNDIIGAFVFDETSNSYICRGMAAITRVPYFEECHQFFLTVYSNEEDGEELIFRVWDSSTNKEHFGIQEEYIFMSGAIYGTPVNPVTIHVNPELFSSISCRSGWNWLSLNLENPESMDVNTLLENLNPSPNDIVKSQTAYAQYVDEFGWVGNLEDISTTETIKLKLAVPHELQIYGNLEDTETTPIRYGSGWNWIGYLPHISISVNQAMANLQSPATGDLLKNQAGYSQFIEGYGWFGSLLFMSPGSGFMLNSSSAGSFTYPNYIIPRDPIVPLYAGNDQHLRDLTGWDVNPRDYEYSSNITSVIYRGEDLLNNQNILLGAFYDDECRGVAAPIRVMDQWMFFLTQYSNVLNQTLTYKVYLADSDTTFVALESLNFINNQVLGNPLQPFSFHIPAAELAKPNNLSLEINGALLQLSWDEVLGADTYKVYASDTPEGEFVEISNLGSFSRNSTGVGAAKEIQWTRRDDLSRLTWTCDLPGYPIRFFRITAFISRR